MATLMPLAAESPRSYFSHLLSTVHSIESWQQQPFQKGILIVPIDNVKTGHQAQQECDSVGGKTAQGVC